MGTPSYGRRDVLRMMTALGAAGFPLSALRADAATAYDPAAKFEIEVSEVELRRNQAGRMLMARIYQTEWRGTVSRPCSICMAARGTARTVTPKNRWIARWPRAACLWSPSI